MKVGLTYIPHDVLLKVARDSGCLIEDQRGFKKITRPGSENKLYIAKTKACARVDLSGFTLDRPDEVRNLGGESFGQVHQQLRFDRTQAEILVSLKSLCDDLATFPSAPRKPKGRPAALPGSQKLPPRPPSETVTDVRSMMARPEGVNPILARTIAAGGETTEPKFELSLDVDAEIAALQRKKSMLEDYAKRSGKPVLPASMRAIDEKLAKLQEQKNQSQGAA